MPAFKTLKKLCSLGVLIPVWLMFICTDSVYSQSITAVNSQEFFENYLYLFEDPSAIVIDGRTEVMFSGGCLGNAINIDADDPDLRKLLQPFMEQPLIVLYCTTVRRTTTIKDVLTEMYKGEIIYISDGIRGWRQNGFPVNGEAETEALPVSKVLPDTPAIPEKRDSI